MGEAEDSLIFIVGGCVLCMILYACVAYIRSDRGDRLSPDMKARMKNKDERALGKAKNDEERLKIGLTRAAQEKNRQKKFKTNAERM